MCARNECDNTEQRLRRQQLRARSRVHVVLRVVVALDLGFHVVIGVGRLNVQQEGFIHQRHFTTHTQYPVQSSFLLDDVVRLCPVIVNSICIPNSCIFHIAKTSLLRCCLYTPSTFHLPTSNFHLPTSSTFFQLLPTSSNFFQLLPTSSRRNTTGLSVSIVVSFLFVFGNFWLAW